MKTCSIDIARPSIYTQSHSHFLHNTFIYHDNEKCSISFIAWVKMLFFRFNACNLAYNKLTQVKRVQ